MAHEAVMLGDAQANLAMDRSAVREHREGLRNREDDGKQKSHAEQEKMIHIGDYIVQPQIQGPRTSPGLSKLAKAGLTAAAVAVGGMGVGAPMAVSWLLQQTSGQVRPEATDRDTQFELKLLPEE